MDSDNKGINEIKSKYILKRIFHILEPNKLFKIIKYRKSLQKRLDLNIKDYKEFGQIIIELEINKAKSSLKKTLNYFINTAKYDKSYYHIYFDDNKEEIKRNYITLSDNIKK